ncbi:alpha/beta fold hydrolase [Clavibacter michiganensis]|uniref:alpha/beta fold hydrolase n=2 Tax=Clavibacter michiganensis TaxID=28447 RepID=UPI001365AA65|nr:alpha/beta hydrolase [Clavibacter michiganensis]MWJ36892.1 alpha/beta hydrolase [Clavibacter michiganensis subsp. michiganensis]
MQLHRVTTGSGARHVGFVHGLGADGATWAPVVERLVATGRFTVTTVDLRGHGQSDRAPAYGIEDMADDLVASLPRGLDAVVGHSLGGSVLVRAVARLEPARAVYLDPGFRLALPTTGIRGRLFWAAPLVGLAAAQIPRARAAARVRAAYPAAAQIPRARAAARVRAAYPAAVRASLDAAQARFDRGMAVGVFRDVAFHPLAVSAPAVPSTLVLSDDAPSVLPDACAADLERHGWDVRRLPGIHHDMQLEDPDRVLAAIEDVL